MSRPRSRSVVYRISFKMEQQEECWKCARIHYDRYCQLELDDSSIMYNSMEPSIADEVKEVSLHAVRMFNESYQIANNISEKFEHLRGGNWQCFVTRDRSSGVTVRPSCFISLKIGQVCIVLFKAIPDKPCWKCGDTLCRGNACQFRLPEIVETDMPEEMKLQAVKWTLKALTDHCTPDMVAKTLVDYFVSEYGQVWQCFITGSRVSGCATMAKKGHHIVIRIQEVNVNIFKAQPENLCWKCGGGLCKGTCLNSEKIETVEIVESNMDAKMLEEAKRCYLEAVKLYDDTLKLCRHISRHFEAKFGGRWNSSYSDTGSIGFYHQSKYHVVLKSANCRISLFRCLQEKPPCWKCSGILCDGKSCHLPPAEIISCQMTKKMEREAIRSAFDAITGSEKPYGVSEWIRSYFELKFAGKWQCAVIANPDKCHWAVSFKPKEQTFIDFKFGSVRIMLFQGEQDGPVKKKKSFTGSLHL